MKRKLPGIFLLCAASFSLFLFVSCVPVAFPVTGTPIPTMTFTAAYDLTLTAVMVSETLTSTPGGPTPSGTAIPLPGDLGWGTVHGKIIDGVTNLPIEGATVKCEHSSYTSPAPCHGVTMTNRQGLYVFPDVFFHDTDRIALFVEAPGYTPLRFEQSFFTQPDFRADLELSPATGDTPTPTPFLMCTPPACQGGVLTCGDPEGCLGGCGTICLTATPNN
jgi:hypothetical protein